jgi:hypothetical protein
MKAAKKDNHDRHQPRALRKREAGDDDDDADDGD